MNWTHRFFYTNLLIITLLISFSVKGNVRLPKLISDGMVLQRDTDAKVGGWANAKENISIQFKDSVYNTTANEKGEWEIILSELSAGGPYTMAINGNNAITIKDIYVGDVWVCSGQSNMELPMHRVKQLYEDEIAEANYQEIRCFTVPKNYNFQSPQEDFEYGSWKSATQDNILDYSAVAYFFAKELYEKYQVPIGILNSSLGGSGIECWISEEKLKPFPGYYNELQKFKSDSLIKVIKAKDHAREQEWYKQLHKQDKGYANSDAKWYSPELNTSDWDSMEVPGYWANSSLGEVNGVVWFRKEVNIPASMTGKSVKLNLGRIIDADSVFVNGYYIGTTSYQYPPRRYQIPADILKTEKNIFVVRVISNRGKGGFVADKPYEIVAGEEKIDLKGMWQYKLGTTMFPLAGETFIRWKPAGLYNAMIAPLLNYKIKGAVWYQGESNTGEPLKYRKLMSTLINDWRSKWNAQDLPFLLVQLPNYMEAKDQPSESNWALFRESQLKSLSIPYTAIAVTIDLGEWNDIHPLNKMDIGRRLSLAAQKIVYKEENVVHSGPIYQSMKVKGNKIELTFKNTGSGLFVKKESELKEFAIAGENRKFVWAMAKIEGNKVIVWSDKIDKPVAVRYAWADNPANANFYNIEGLPASPFRTDEW